MLLCIFDMPHTHSLHPKATGHVCVHDYIYYMCTHTPVLHTTGSRGYLWYRNVQNTEK